MSTISTTDITSTTSTNRRGFAMAVAMFAIVIIGTLVAGVFFASTQEFRAARNSLIQERALTAAEYGQNRVLTRWIRQTALAMPPGDTMFFVDTASNGAIDTVLVTRLNDLTYWVVSEGRAGTGVQLGSRRRTGMVITLGVPNMRVPGAVVSRGQDSLGGNSNTSGNDVQPSGWDCPPAGPPASVLVGPDTTVKYLGVKYTMSGATPLVREDPLAGDTNSYFNLDGDGWTGMTSKANIVINNPGSLTIADIYPRALSGTCVLGPSNWGDFERNALLPGACETYFPMVHIRGPGTTLLNGGGPPYRGGQGILLVDGNLEIAGNFTYKGLIIVRGRIKTTGTGVKIQGGVMTANMNGMWNDIRGDAGIQYSRCAIMTVLQQKAWPKPAKERAWADMF